MKILIVIDMQKDFIDGSLGTEEAQTIVPAVVKKIKTLKDGDMLITTKDTHTENYLDTLEGKKLPVKHCIMGTDGWMLNEDIVQAFEEMVEELGAENCFTILKYTFGHKDWESILPDIEKVDEIEICGLCTDICVVSNALILRALYPNTIIKVDSKCCAGVTPETHEKALATMKMCQIDVI
jgi:nicotinamidase-related amidase